MKESEKAIIGKIQRLQSLSATDYNLEKEINSDLQGIMDAESNFGNFSDEFITHSDLILFLNKEPAFGLDHIFLRLRIEAYLLAVNTNEPSQTEKLNDVDSALRECLKRDCSPEKKESGTALPPSRLVEHQLVRNVFLTNNEALIKIFLTHLPMPPVEVFHRDNVPQIIVDRRLDSMNKIQEMLLKHDQNLALLESAAMKIQRSYRMKIRKKEESQRVYQRYRSEDKTKEETDLMLKDANTPYTPKCPVNFPGLAKKIMDAAKEVKLFNTLRHLTAPSALGKILEVGLYGRRRLLHAYLPFKPAALKEFDIKQGDGNVVCLGANKIDSTAAQNAELTFNVDKIIAGKPSAFYKQRDLGFNHDEKRHVMIGELKVIFSHTTRTNSQPNYTSPFILYENETNSRVKAAAYLEADLLIAYDLKKMHQILTLNFFRFVDKLHFPWEDPDFPCSEKKEIYSALNKLSKEDLITTLQAIGEKMTDTMEFNFYGAYKIDFSTLLTIKSNNYTLALPDFIEALNHGQMDKLDEVRSQIPQIFESERFIAYLRKNISNPQMIEALNFDPSAIKGNPLLK